LKHFSGSNYSQIAAAPPLYIQSNDLQFRDYTNGDYYIRAVRDGSVELYHNNIKRFETSSVGVSIPQDLDVDGHTNLDNVSIAGVTTFS
ncbi:MAG: hypothetical protein VXY93_22310, partial [Pseudomonadota bacterium]|nr:hypothetical protein [Pseudomonadota bacterium]